MPLKLFIVSAALSMGSAPAQITLTPVERTGAAGGPATTQPVAAPAPQPCKPKKKSGFSLGGVLKAAKDSGLGSVLAGKVGGNMEGAIAATAANTAASVVAAAENAAAATAPRSC